jgi:hypothetical protein
VTDVGKLIFADLVKKMPESSMDEKEAVKRTSGWFEKFKRRTGIHCVVRHGEAASSKNFSRILQEFHGF